MLPSVVIKRLDLAFLTFWEIQNRDKTTFIYQAQVWKNLLKYKLMLRSLQSVFGKLITRNLKALDE